MQGLGESTSACPVRTPGGTARKARMGGRRQLPEQETLTSLGANCDEGLLGIPPRFAEAKCPGPCREEYVRVPKLFEMHTARSLEQAEYSKRALPVIASAMMVCGDVKGSRYRDTGSDTSSRGRPQRRRCPDSAGVILLQRRSDSLASSFGGEHEYWPRRLSSTAYALGLRSERWNQPCYVVLAWCRPFTLVRERYTTSGASSGADVPVNHRTFFPPRVARGNKSTDDSSAPVIPARAVSKRSAVATLLYSHSSIVIHYLEPDAAVDVVSFLCSRIPWIS